MTLSNLSEPTRQLLKRSTVQEYSIRYLVPVYVYVDTDTFEVTRVIVDDATTDIDITQHFAGKALPMADAHAIENDIEARPWPRWQFGW